MRNLVNIVIKVDKDIKNDFYTLCKTLSITPMRACLILINRFSKGKIDALPVIEDYKIFKQQEVHNKTMRILKNRIDGKLAYKINKRNKKKDGKL